MQNRANTLTVSQYSNYIKNIIAAEDMLHGVYLVGEVSGVSRSGGNLYFTLKDEYAQIACCQFNKTNAYAVQNGEKVIVFGSADFYIPWGKMSFIVVKIEPFGKGKLHEQLEKLKLTLTTEGLFLQKHKKILPQFVHDVCIVTSITGAVIEDIKSTIRRYNGYINICISDTKVQGAGAANSIIAALKLADKSQFDVIILARGGGSFEDLMPFNDENVVRTIFAMETPIISAVGHETDVTLCDFVADERALTPTAAAERVAFSEMDFKRSFALKLSRMNSIIQTKIDSDLSKVRNSIKEIYHVSKSKLDKIEVGVNHAISNIGQVVSKKVVENEFILKERRTKLQALSPYTLLQSGYFKMSDSNGKPLVGVKKLHNGERVVLYGCDGTVEAQIIKEV